MTSTVDVQRAVLRSDLPAPSRQIVLTLAAVADFATGVVPDEFSPSLSDLATMTGLSRACVALHLNNLESSGWVGRNRPDPVKARAEGATTSYWLMVGRSPGDGLVQEMDHPGSPGDGPPVVQEMDRGSPGAGPIKRKTPTGSTQPHTGTRQGQTRAAPAQRSDSSASNVEHLCLRLADRIETNGSQRPEVTAAWRTAARALLNRRPYDEIAELIDWCQQDKFWRANVLDMPYFRRKYDQLRLQASRRPTTAEARAAPATRHIDQLTPDQRAARNPFLAAVKASDHTGAIA